MTEKSIIVGLALIGVCTALYFLIRLLRTQKPKAKEQNQQQYSSLAATATPQAGVIRSTPVAKLNRQGRLITQGSPGQPPEPGGYVVDSEITQATAPSSFRTWYNFDDQYPKSIFGPDAYGDFFYPMKSGFYVRSGYW